MCWNRENPVRKTLCVARATSLKRSWVLPALVSVGAQLRSLGRALNITEQSRGVLTFWYINLSLDGKLKSSIFIKFIYL